ncbi:MAG: GNAT family N-acetyltransferase [Anaerolineaceae bacterium]|nr:GNAT family N-acetyltransferase [Anaerolineaceae bacterium]
MENKFTPLMDFEIREATQKDISWITAVKKSCWPEENADPDLIKNVLEAPHHSIQVAVCDDVIAGFVDSFLTNAGDGTPRWEVDLLAVHPEYRGRKLGEQLVRASIGTKLAKQATLTRALIQVENIASQVTFSRCGFQLEEQVCSLFISNDQTQDSLLASVSLSLITVTTMNYRGLWLENEFTSESFRAALSLLSSTLDIVGAIIPASQEAGCRAARKSGYKEIGQYQWWIWKI